MLQNSLYFVGLLTITTLAACGPKRASDQVYAPASPRPTASQTLGASQYNNDALRDARGAYRDVVSCTATQCNPVNVKLTLAGTRDPRYGQGFMWQGGDPVDWGISVQAENANRKMGIRLYSEFTAFPMEAQAIGSMQNSLKILWTPYDGMKVQDMVHFMVRDMDRCAALAPEAIKPNCYEMGVETPFDFPVKVPFFVGDVFRAEEEENSMSPWTGFATCLASGILSQFDVGPLTNDLVTGVIGGMMGGKVQDCRSAPRTSTTNKDTTNQQQNSGVEGATSGGANAAASGPF